MKFLQAVAQDPRFTSGELLKVIDGKLNYLKTDGSFAPGARLRV